MKQRWRAALRSVPVICVMGTIFFFSHQPGDTLSLPSIPGIDKLAHMIVYGILAASLLFAFTHSLVERSRVIAMVLTVGICFFYGVFDEYHQSFIAERFPSAFDLLADVVGAIVFCLIWNWRKNRMNSPMFFMPGH